MSEVAPLPRGARERLAAIPMPPRIAKLPRESRGYPIPRFIDRKADKPNGEPDFRFMDPQYLAECIRFRMCWVCGGALPRLKTFPIGPMCVVNRNTAEPPSHIECARYSAQVCPFLAFPKMRRIEKGMPDDVRVSGTMIPRNPGVMCLYTVRQYEVWHPRPGETLFDIGEAVEVEWWAEGRTATRVEVEASIASGMPLLEAEAMKQEGAMADLARCFQRAQPLLPAA